MTLPTVTSIGINSIGDSVIRIRLEGGREIEASTNLVSFAKLAAAGVTVLNDAQKKPGARKA